MQGGCGIAGSDQNNEDTGKLVFSVSILYMLLWYRVSYRWKLERFSKVPSRFLEPFES